MKKRRVFAACAWILSCVFCAGCAGFGIIGGSNSKMKTPIKIIAPEGEVFPYIDDAKLYLLAPEDMNNVGGYCAAFGACPNPNKAITLEWECDEKKNITSITLEYGLKNDKNPIKVTLPGDARTYDLYNLYKASEYVWSVTAQAENGKKWTVKSNFTTTDLGPRVMKVDGIYNVRDVGGYMTDEGKRTVQGLLYRGGALAPADVYDSQLTPEGALVMLEVMGIKTELDVRGKGAESGDVDKSPIPGADLEYIPISGYSDCFTLQENYRQVFSLLADRSKYPVYFHCTGGADRTGTVAFLVNALLGVSEKDLIQDYEFTSFSIYGERNAQRGNFSDYFVPFRKKLETYTGDTLKEKVESYMRSIGVTEQEIANIRAIMLGE